MSRANAISLSDYFEDFVEQQAAGGRYNSPSDVIEAGLRLLEIQENKLLVLRKAIADGDTSGLAVPLDFQELYDEIDADEEAPE